MDNLYEVWREKQSGHDEYMYKRLFIETARAAKRLADFYADKNIYVRDHDLDGRSAVEVDKGLRAREFLMMLDQRFLE